LSSIGSTQEGKALPEPEILKREYCTIKHTEPFYLVT